MGCADGESLILLDEVGAGTDPVEGAALAESILEALRQKGSKIIATTHYAELKAYALQTDGVENACCEFDVATLRPTYRLLIGMPGRSNAFAISLRLGMDQAVIGRARQLVSGENRRFEDVVGSLEESRKKLEDEREEAQRARLESEKARSEAEEEQKRIRTQTDREISEARRRASEIVSRTRAQADAVLNELDEIKKRKGKTLSAGDRAQINAGMRAMENSADPVTRREEKPYRLPRPLRAGDAVLLSDLGKEGTVLRPPDKDSGKALVQAGILQMHVPVSSLRLVREKPKRRELFRTVTKELSGDGRGDSPLELDLRGQTAEEAVMNLDRFLDSAVLSGVGQVTVIHGKGTGVLRSAVQRRLRGHPEVQSFRLGTYGEGESGVTIVKLK